jgi:uncharacterized protein (DUF2235 family)
MQSKSAVLERLSDKMQAKGYGWKTQHFYMRTIEAFLTFHGGRDPRFMGMTEIELFVAYRIRQAHIPADLKQKSFEALFFFFTQVLGRAPQKEYIDASRNQKESLHAASIGSLNGSSKRKMIQQVMIF